jgi:pectate disaccharide-lyase
VQAAAAPRGSNGELPAATLLALRTGSDLVDRGVILPGYSYSGAAPDLGARELIDHVFGNGFEN